MLTTLVEVAGGLGLFLLGMVIMTEGLQGIAGESLQRLIRRATRSPTSGAAMGTLVTALVQSSSATTVSAVGFAGAGLVTFPQALGIVFGANLGTTVTGWMIVLLGFKLTLGVAMPLAVLAGVLLRIFARGRTSSAGYALAGFGMIFIGIAALRAGMIGLEGIVTPDRFPGDDVLGRLQLVGVGIGLTLVTQSSSAGVATALVAISTGAITLPQAAAMVIGMDVGTTATAALATFGASLPARRTGSAHVIFNLGSGVLAFLLLPLFLWALDVYRPGLTGREPELVLVGFHTSFNTLGVVLVLPFAARFARLVERLVPDRPTPFTRRLDRALLANPGIALRALGPTLVDLACYSFEALRERLRARELPAQHADRLALLRLALDEVERYLAEMAPSAPGGRTEARRVAALHVIDQLRRLLHRCAQRQRAATVFDLPELGARARSLVALLQPAIQGAAGAQDDLASLRHELEQGRPAFRDAVARSTGAGRLDASEGLDRMDAYRWLERVTHHVWRTVYHLEQMLRDEPTPRVSEPPEPD